MRRFEWRLSFSDVWAGVEHPPQLDERYEAKVTLTVAANTCKDVFRDKEVNHVCRNTLHCAEA